MWIRSQDRQTLGDFKGIVIIAKTSIVGLIDGNERGIGNLGKYETERRSMEVLNDIHECLHMELIAKTESVFEMPKN